jgi:hypothetical protein
VGAESAVESIQLPDLFSPSKNEPDYETPIQGKDVTTEKDTLPSPFIGRVIDKTDVMSQSGCDFDEATKRHRDG